MFDNFVHMAWLLPVSDETTDQTLFDDMGITPCQLNDLPEVEEEDDSWADNENWEVED